MKSSPAILLALLLAACGGAADQDDGQRDPNSSQRETESLAARCDLRGACDDAVVTVTIGPEDPDTPDDPSNPDGPDRTTVLIQGGACDGGGAGGGWAWLAALALGVLAITRRRRA